MTTFYHSLQHTLVAVFCLWFSSVSLAENCPKSATRAFPISSCTVTGSASSIQLNFISGFSSTTAIEPVGGNNGITVGEQRRLTFIKVAEILSDQLTSSQTIVINARFTALECDANSAALGSAGPSNSIAYDESDPLPSGAQLHTFYPIALANALSNEDIALGEADIDTNFNSKLGLPNCLEGSGWYYGFDDQAVVETGFLTVLLHEITHGLGFTSFVNPETGEKSFGINDIYSQFLFIKSLGATWNELGNSVIDNQKRRNSAINENDLFWNGAHANAMAIGLLTDGFSNNDGDPQFTAGDHIQMYSPDPLELGSSVSHFSTSVSPNELMEPNLTVNTCGLGLALGVLEDLGWTVQYPSHDDFYINLHCQALNDGDVVTNQFVGDDIKLTPVSSINNYVYTLSYEGSLEPDLIQQTSNGLFIGSPSTGEFAGDYVLTVSNGNDPDISITIKRPLRLVWSSDVLMNNQTSTLTIEGGAANSVYDLSQDPVDVINFLNAQNIEVTSITASNNAAQYNPATLNITTNEIITTENVTAIISSQSNRYDTVEDEITAYPSILHSFTVKDSSDNPLEDVQITLFSSNLVEQLGLPTQYVTSSNGSLTMHLPNTDDEFTLRFSLDGFSNQFIDVTSLVSQHSVTLVSTNEPETPNQLNSETRFGSSGGPLTLWLLSLIGIVLWRPLRHLRA